MVLVYVRVGCACVFPRFKHVFVCVEREVSAQGSVVRSVLPLFFARFVAFFSACCCCPRFLSVVFVVFCFLCFPFVAFTFGVRARTREKGVGGRASSRVLGSKMRKCQPTDP